MVPRIHYNLDVVEQLCEPLQLFVGRIRAKFEFGGIASVHHISAYEFELIEQGLFGHLEPVVLGRALDFPRGSELPD